MALNNLTESSIIHPGDKLLVRVAQDQVLVNETQIITSTATLDQVTATSPPKRTAIPVTPPNTLVTGLVAGRSATGPDNVLANSTEQEVARPKFDPLLVAIIALGVIGAGLLVFGSLLKRKD